ncbi:MAG TPA: hypothetical protein DCR93_19860 [Cytophagales bacterium]|nr:hypothetical protein [Cytophagales bacterium]HAP61656.1 hypothetical protein [Cytophagales bacterium]
MVQAQTGPSSDSTQIDTVVIVVDSTTLASLLGPEEGLRWGTPYTARKAGMLSAALPGLGQAYNGRYWKIPLVYGAFGGAGYLAWFYHQLYEDNLVNLLYEIDGDVDTFNLSGVGESTLRTRVNTYRRSRDYMYIGIGLVYLLSIAEAHIDAQLKGFDLEDDLLVGRYRFEVNPLVVATPSYTGVGISIALP